MRQGLFQNRESFPHGPLDFLGDPEGPFFEPVAHRCRGYCVQAGQPPFEVCLNRCGIPEAGSLDEVRIEDPRSRRDGDRRHQERRSQPLRIPIDCAVPTPGVQRLQILGSPGLGHDVSMQEDVSKLLRHCEAVEAGGRMVRDLGVNNDPHVVGLRLVPNQTGHPAGLPETREDV